MGYDGLKKLKMFIEKGGLFITEGSTAALPIDMAITRRVSIKQSRNLVARGSLFRAIVEDGNSPIMYGYQDTVAVYFSQSPVFQVNKNTGGFRNPDWLQDEIWQKEVPRVVLSFAKKYFDERYVEGGKRNFRCAPGAGCARWRWSCCAFRQQAVLALADTWQSRHGFQCHTALE